MQHFWPVVVHCLSEAQGVQDAVPPATRTRKRKPLILFFVAALRSCERRIKNRASTPERNSGMWLRAFLRGAALACVLALYRLVRACIGYTPRIVTGSSTMRALLAACPALQNYRPTPWLLSGLLQTAASVKMAHPPCEFIRDEIQLPALRRPPGSALCCLWAAACFVRPHANPNPNPNPNLDKRRHRR